MQLLKRVGVYSTTVYDALLRGEGTGSGLPLVESQLTAGEEHDWYQQLLGSGWAGGNMQSSPLMGSLREKGGQHPILEVYYFHIS